MSDIISLVSNKLHLGTGTDFQEAQSTAELIVGKVLLTNNLEPLAFLTSAGKFAKLTGGAEDLKTRPEDITFVRFHCVMDSLSVYSRVTCANNVFFHFSLRLP